MGERQGRARGPGLPLPRARGATSSIARKVDRKMKAREAIIERDPTAHRGSSSRTAGIARRGHRPHQALLLDLPEAAPQRRRHRAALRLPGLPHRRRRRSRDCYAALGRGPPALAPGPGPDQGLHRDAEAELLPVAAHDGDRRDRPAVRDPDPHPRDGPHRRARASRPTGSTRRDGSAPPPTTRASLAPPARWSGRSEVSDPRQFLSSLKVDLYPDEV